MHYSTWTIWIFVVLLLVVALMIAFPSNLMLIIGTALLPVLIAVQVYVILKAREQSQKKFSEGDWYEDQ
jgi:branched-subunit amino acid permease